MFGWSQREKSEGLYEALRHGKVADAEKWLKRGAVPNYHHEYSREHPLLQVMSYNNEIVRMEMTEVLLRHGADPGYTFNDGDTLLHRAAQSSRDIISFMQRMIALGQDLQAKNKLGTMPLDGAIQYKRWKTAAFIIENTPDIAERIYGNNAPVMMYLLDKEPPIDIVKKMLPSPSVVNNAYGDMGITLLHDVVQKRPVILPSLLTVQGINLDARDKHGRTALVLAVQKPDEETADRLLAAGAAPQVTDTSKHTPLYYAAEKGSIRLVKSLLSAIARRGETADLSGALSAAAGNGHARVMELLIEAGADVNERISKARTPLMLAALENRTEALEVLIKAGAKTDLSDKHGMQAYDLAVGQGAERAKNMLARYRVGGAVAQAPKAVESSVAAAAKGYALLNPYSVEMQQGAGLSLIFNFFTQQMMIRDAERTVPVVVQNFADVQRQAAIAEAYAQLKALGGDAPAPDVLPDKPAAGVPKLKQASGPKLKPADGLKLKPAGG